MKRYRIANKFRFTAFLTIMILITVFTFGSLLGFFDVNGLQNKEFTTVKVTYGDTLWSLAKTYGPADRDVRQTIFEICDMNNITASTLQAGMYITIPR